MQIDELPENFSNAINKYAPEFGTERTKMTNDLMDYEELLHDAYRVIVRKVLSRVAKTGLPGEHHFYIAFRTKAPGVSLPDFLVERYPEEMTIVLQHDFWGLEVDEDGFEVHLHFDRKPTRMVIPFHALTGFLDPSVQFGVKFDDEDIPGGTSQPRTGNSGLDFSGLATDADLELGNFEGDDQEDEGERETGTVIALDSFRKE